jgi:hypothetical protein
MPPLGQESRRLFAVLVRLFLRQFASLESVSTGGELKQAAVAILTLLAAPGYYVSTMAVWNMPRPPGVAQAPSAPRRAPRLRREGGPSRHETRPRSIAAQSPLPRADDHTAGG